MADERKPTTFRPSAWASEKLDSFAAGWDVDRSAVVERGIRNLAVAEELESYIGSGPDAGEQALRCWADVLARAGAAVAEAFTPIEWCMIADACNGTLWEPRIGEPGRMVAANVEDGHRLDGTGYRWLGDDATELAGSLSKAAGGKVTPAMRKVDQQVSSLVQRLADLDYAHGWAVIVACQWFWSHCQDDIDPRKDPWWTSSYRKRLARVKGEE